MKSMSRTAPGAFVTVGMALATSLATGSAYAGDNDPFFFEGAPQHQALTPLKFDDCALADGYRIHLFDPDKDGDLDTVRVLESGILDLGINVDGELQYGSVDFLSGLNYGPFDLVIGEFNGDGNDDIAVGGTLLAPDAPGVVRIFFGDGTGAFPTQTDVAIAGHEPILDAGDFDGDQLTEIVALSDNDWCGDGTDSFITIIDAAGVVSQTTLGELATQMEVGDADGDFDLDLILLPKSTNGTSRLLTLVNDGTGTFVKGAEFGPIPYSFTLRSADLDNDGDLDSATVELLLGNAGTNLIVHLNDGTGDLSTKVVSPIYATGVPVNNLIPADLNGDGIVDLLAATDNNSMGALTVLIGDGTGGFAPLSTLTLRAKDAVVFDLSGNDALCIATSHGQVVTVGDDGSIGGHRVELADGFFFDFALIDLNGDGLDDIATIDAMNGEIDRYFADGEGAFTQGPSVLVPGMQISSLLPADIDGDGADDLIGVSGPVLTSIDGSGSKPAVKVTMSAYLGFNKIAGDLNGDGLTDVVLTDKYSSSGVVALAQGSGLFAELPFDFIGPPGEVAITDLNGDANPDLVYADRLDGFIYTLPGMGDGTFATRTLVASQAGLNSQLDDGDFDLDGDIDLVLGMHNGFIVLTNDGTGAMSQQQVIDGYPTALTDLEFVDLNADGGLELVIRLKENEAPLLPYRFNGNQFVSVGHVVDGLGSVAYPYGGTRFGDIDGDGLVDLVEFNQICTTYLGEGPQIHVYANRSALRRDGRATAGHTVDLRISDEGAANQPYILLASSQGTWPGIEVGGSLLPLNPDPFLFGLATSGSPVFSNFLGTLDSKGKATAHFLIPAGIQLTQEVPLDFAFITLDAKNPGLVRTSNSLGISVQ